MTNPFLAERASTSNQLIPAAIHHPFSVGSRRSNQCFIDLVNRWLIGYQISQIEYQEMFSASEFHLFARNR